ncbi:serine hydrolase [Streptomyces sp. NPDC096097]|uniref:serine hydrolase n=1 Tax=Streptomyces sp. NPDC096097 TaxID=3155546 RepID=UPI00332090FE
MRTLPALGAAGAAVLLAAAVALPATAAPTPPPAPKPQISDAAVDRAVARLDSTVEDMMRRTGVPGVSVAVVHNDKVVHIKGYGLRRTGESAKVGPDTVFQLASVSKPVSSTIVAGALTDPQEWDNRTTLPGFSLKDPWVSDHVTAADLFSHRSGLPDHAGDLLEDLGYDQAYILDHLRLEPLAPFRASYAYTNFGLTAAAEAVARAKGTSWQKLSADTLFKPAGMTRTSTEFSDFINAPDHASTHVKTVDPSTGAVTWSPRFVRDPDAQSPAGGITTATDMARWLRLQLAGGTLDGKRIIPADTLARTHLPEIVSQPTNAIGTTSFYGLGWNVGYDQAGRLRLSHSGGFELGANTNVTMLPLEKLGIVVLTNGAPVGLPDAVALDFFDYAEHGKVSTDWLPLAASAYAAALAAPGASTTDYAHPPKGAQPAQDSAAYTGTYDNPYYGKATVTADDKGALTLALGPKPLRFPLTHYDGDTFSFVTQGENAIGRTGVFFTDGSLRVEYLDAEHLGTFTQQ